MRTLSSILSCDSLPFSARSKNTRAGRSGQSPVVVARHHAVPRPLSSAPVQSGSLYNTRSNMGNANSIIPAGRDNNSTKPPKLTSSDRQFYNGRDHRQFQQDAISPVLESNHGPVLLAALTHGDHSVDPRSSSVREAKSLGHGVVAAPIPAYASSKNRPKASTVDTEQNNIDKLQSKIQELEEELEILKTRVKDEEAKVRQYSQQAGRMNEAYGSMKLQYTQEYEGRAYLAQQISSFEDTIVELERRIEELKEGENVLEKTLQGKDEQLAELDREFEKRIEELKEEKNVLEKTLQGKDEQLSELDREFERRIEGLKEEKNVLEKTLQGKDEQLSELDREFERRIGGLKEERNVLEKTLQGKDEQLSELDREFERRIEGFEEEKNVLEKKLQEKDEQLVEFDRYVVRMSDERPEAIRDDRHFETNFSGLFAGIQAWVVTYYLTAHVDDEVLENISKAMRDWFVRRLGEQWVVVLKAHTLEVLEGFVADEVRRCLFLPVLFGFVKDVGGVFKAMETCADAEELTRWRLSTIALLLRRADFQPSLAQKLDTLATSIVDSLEPLLASSTKAYKARTRKLRTLLQQAADLAIQFQQEPSTFSFPEFEPGMDCLATKMGDAEGLRDEKQLEGDREKVIMTVFPGVVRKGDIPVGVGSEFGNQEVVVLKAKVFATATVGQGEGGGELNGEGYVNGVHGEKERFGEVNGEGYVNGVHGEKEVMDQESRE